MKLDEMMRRNEPQDQIELGLILEGPLKSQFGELLRCIINGIQAEQLAESSARDSKLTSDRALGRIEGLNMLTDRLDLIVAIKDELVIVKRAQQEVKPGENK